MPGATPAASSRARVAGADTRSSTRSRSRPALPPPSTYRVLDSIETSLGRGAPEVRAARRARIAAGREPRSPAQAQAWGETGWSLTGVISQTVRPAPGRRNACRDAMSSVSTTR
jgi:hypothetical protein